MVVGVHLKDAPLIGYLREREAPSSDGSDKKRGPQERLRVREEINVFPTVPYIKHVYVCGVTDHKVLVKWRLPQWGPGVEEMAQRSCAVFWNS